MHQRGAEGPWSCLFWNANSPCGEKQTTQKLGALAALCLSHAGLVGVHDLQVLILYVRLQGIAAAELHRHLGSIPIKRTVDPISKMNILKGKWVCVKIQPPKKPAGFSSCFYLPGFHFGYQSWNHSRLESGEKSPPAMARLGCPFSDPC